MMDDGADRRLSAGETLGPFNKVVAAAALTAEAVPSAAAVADVAVVVELDGGGNLAGRLGLAAAWASASAGAGAGHTSAGAGAVAVLAQAEGLSLHSSCSSSAAVRGGSPSMVVAACRQQLGFSFVSTLRARAARELWTSLCTPKLDREIKFLLGAYGAVGA